MLQQTMFKHTTGKTNRVQLVVTYAVLLVLLVFLLWGIVRAWLLFWDFISRSNPTVGAAIIAASGTILISVFTLVWNRRSERQNEIKQRQHQIELEIREQKLPIYEELIAFMFKVVNSHKTGKPIPEDEMNTFFLDLTEKTIVWGSDEFVRAFGAFRESNIIQTQTGATLLDPMAATLAFERLLYTIRADFGHDNKGLGEGDLLALFVNDVRDELKKYRGTNQSP